jgi:type IV pilus assembly protein PilE
MTIAGGGAVGCRLPRNSTPRIGSMNSRHYPCPAYAAARRQHGITLVELMVVMVIVAVLGMIAIPSYRQYSIRAQRTEAKTALLRLAANQERFYLQNNTYSSNLAALGFPGGVSENGVYTLNVPLANAQAFQATATPTPGGGVNGRDMTTDGECAQFNLNSQGLKTANPDPNNLCW